MKHLIHSYMQIDDNCEVILIFKIHKIIDSLNVYCFAHLMSNCI